MGHPGREACCRFFEALQLSQRDARVNFRHRQARADFQGAAKPAQPVLEALHAFEDATERVRRLGVLGVPLEKCLPTPSRFRELLAAFKQKSLRLDGLELDRG